MNESQVLNVLESGIEQLELSLAKSQLMQLIDYLHLLYKWNKTYNLTAIRSLNDMVIKHILDSLTVVPFFKTINTVLDVGTGAGLPGIPLAIVYPEKSVTLLDANSKKTRFLMQVKALLKLENIHVEHQRVESFQPVSRFEGITSRAFASLEDIWQSCHHLLEDNGKILAMKGKYPAQELDSLDFDVVCENSFALEVPGESAKRHLVVLSRG